MLAVAFGKPLTCGVVEKVSLAQTEEKAAYKMLPAQLRAALKNVVPMCFLCLENCLMQFLKK